MTSPTVGFQRIVFVVILAALSSTVWLFSVQAESSRRIERIPTQVQWQQPKPSKKNPPKKNSSQKLQALPPLPSQGAPNDRPTGHAGDGLCPAVDRNLTALIPAFQQEGTKAVRAIGVTVSEHPTFWFYVPYQTKRLAEFVLIDEQEEDVYNTGLFAIEKGQKPEIISLKLPEMVKLQVGKQYRWVFSIVCNQSDRSGDMTVNGWIQRIEPDATLQRGLTKASTPLERVALYAQSGIWYDALTTLAELRRDHKDAGIEENWKALLESASLKPLYEVDHSVQISPCCKPERASRKREF